MGCCVVVFHGVGRISVEIRQAQPQDTLPDDMVVVRLSQYGLSRGNSGYGRGLQQQRAEDLNCCHDGMPGVCLGLGFLLHVPKSEESHAAVAQDQRLETGDNTYGIHGSSFSGHSIILSIRG